MVMLEKGFNILFLVSHLVSGAHIGAPTNPDLTLQGLLRCQHFQQSFLHTQGRTLDLWLRVEQPHPLHHNPCWPTANILVGNGATAVNDPTPAGVRRNEIQNHHTESPLPGPGLIIALAGLFLWSNNSTFIHKSAPHILKVHIPEKLVLEFASALRNEVNRALAVLREIAARKDLKIFFMVIVGLWIASILGGCCDFLTLFYVSAQQSMRRMIYPTGLEHASPALSHGTKDEMHHATHANRMTVKISSNRLKYLILVSCNNLIEIDLDTPSVVSRLNRGHATSEDDLKKQMRLPRS
ncbi:Reticulon-like protein B2 [Capsicum annuum]|nr:Reticulon-like protein B2 [Capsicum annuum]